MEDYFAGVMLIISVIVLCGAVNMVCDSPMSNLVMYCSEPEQEKPNKYYNTNRPPPTGG